MTDESMPLRASCLGDPPVVINSTDSTLASTESRGSNAVTESRWGLYLYNGVSCFLHTKYPPRLNG